MVTQTDIMETLAETLQRTGEAVIPAGGASMGGEFLRARGLVVRALGGMTPRWGDVLVYRRDDRWVAHRIIWRLPQGWITKGDANWAPDRPIVAFADGVGLVTGLKMEEGILPLRHGRRRAADLWRALTGLGAALLWTTPNRIGLTRRGAHRADR